MKHLAIQDFQKIPVINLRLENLASAPSPSGTDFGYAYYDTGLGYIRVWTGSAWLNMNNVPAAGSITSAMILDGTIADADIATNAAIQQSKLSLSITNAEINAAAGIVYSKLDATTVQAAVRANRLDQFAAPTAAVSFNSQLVTNVATPVSGTDAANKNYVDASSAGFNVQASARVATTAAITLSGAQTIDGISVVAGDRVLVKNGSTGNPGTTSIDNGLYVAAAGAWARATDQSANSGVNGIQAGDFVFVEQGTANAASAWIVTTQGAVTIGTTQITWAQVGSATSYTAGTGITISSNQISINTGYVGQTSITTLGTIATGTWQGTAVGVAYGGTGATTAAGARTALGAVGKFAATLATSATSYVVNHNLSTTDIEYSVKEISSSAIVDADCVVTDANNVTISFAVAPSANAYRVTVIG